MAVDELSDCPYEDEDGVDCDECGLCDEVRLVDELELELDDLGD